jgi:hypothetical protein
MVLYKGEKSYRAANKRCDSQTAKPTQNGTKYLHA